MNFLRCLFISRGGICTIKTRRQNRVTVMIASKGYPTNTWAELIWSGLLVLISGRCKRIPSWVFVISIYRITPFPTSWIWLFYIHTIFFKCHWNYLRGADLTGQSLQMVSALLIIQKFRNNCRMSCLRRNFSLALFESRFPLLN